MVQRVRPAPATFDPVVEFASAADRVGILAHNLVLREAVPTCPGWTVYDLIVHLGNIHAWAATIVETGRSAIEQNDEPHHRRNRDLADWYLGKAEDLGRVLREADPRDACWNFAFGQGHKAFWSRRQLHETLIHELDLVLSSEAVPRLRADLAADGVDEALTVFLRRMHDRGYPARLTWPVSLVASDVDAEWTVMPTVGDAPTIHIGSSPDADQIIAPAASLFALLWKRTNVGDPTVVLEGDQERLLAFLGSRLTP